MDVVVLAAGEILEGRAELLGNDDTEINAHVVRPEARFVRPGFDNVVSRLPVGESFDNGLAVLAGNKHVDITDCIFPASNRAGDLKSTDGLNAIEIAEDVICERAGLTESFALLALAGKRNLLENVLFGFCTKARELLDLTGFGCGFEFVEIRNAEFRIERPNRLWPDAFDAGERGHIDRHRLAKLAELRDRARLEVFDDFRGNRVADAVDVLDGVLAGRRKLIDRLGMLLDVFGCPAVGVWLVLDALGFESISKLNEQPGDLVVITHFVCVRS